MRSRSLRSPFLSLSACLVASGTLSAQSLVPIATIPRDPSVVVGEVTDLDVAPTGEVVILDNLSHAVLVFDSTGRWLRTVGREGAGPGELRGAEEMECRGDEIAVLDYRNLRITVWALSGEVRRTVPLPRLAGAGVWPHELLWEREGAWLKVSHFAPDEPVMVVRLSTDLRAARDTALVVRPDDPAAATCQFCPLTVSAELGLVGVRGDTLYAIAALDSRGHAAATWTRGDLPAVRRNAARLERLRGWLARRGAAEGGRGNPAVSVYQVRFAARSLGFDAAGRLWTLPSAEEGASALDVFVAPGSRPVTVPLAQPIRGFRIRGERLVAVTETPAGEPAVRVYRIVR